jgi:TRAP transporter TAXI family solute receptor
MLQIVRRERLGLTADGPSRITTSMAPSIRSPILRAVAGASWLLAALVMPACGAKPPAAKSPAVVRITTGLPGMTFKPLGEALAHAFESAVADAHFEVIETAGSVANLQKLESGEADLGFALADVAYTAFNGRGVEFPSPARTVRGIAVLHPSAVHVLVPAGSMVESIADLRGRIGVGPAGSGTAVTSALLLNAFGVPQRDITNLSLPFISASQALATGDLDAAFVVAADPVDAVHRATSAGARLVSINGEQVRRLRSEYPFLRPGTIPAGTYQQGAGPIPTMLVDVLLLTREGLDDELVRRLTSALFEVLPQLAATNDFLRLMDTRRAPATPLPLHAGAALYYRERELSR